MSRIADFDPWFIGALPRCRIAHLDVLFLWCFLWKLTLWCFLWKLTLWDSLWQLTLGDSLWNLIQMAGIEGMMESFVSRSGIRVTVRPLSKRDVPLMVDLFHHLSPESLYHRFHVPLDHLSDVEVKRRVRKLAQVDQVNQVALIALVDGKEGRPTAIAVARAHRLPGSTEAEAAVVVRDDFQNQGIGLHLLRRLVNAAVAVGITTFKGYIQAENWHMLHLLRKIGLQYTQYIEHAETYVLIQLPAAPLDDVAEPAEARPVAVAAPG